MAITSSAKKAHRASLKKRVFNLRRKRAVDTVVKEIRTLVSQKKLAEAQKLLPRAYQAYDKAAKEYTIKRGAADRKKSRLAKLFKTSA